MRIIVILFLFLSTLCGAQVLKTDAQLSTQSTNRIKNLSLNQTRLDSMIQNAVASKASRLEVVNTSGTNTYAATHGAWLNAYQTNLGIKIRVKTASTGVSTLNVNTIGAKKIFMDPTTQAGSGDLVDEQVYEIVYDAALDAAVGGWLVVGSGSDPPDIFDDDVTFVLPTGETFGKYSNGETAEWTGLTAIEAILDAAVDYIDPVFTSFSVSGQASTVEVGTTLSGSKTFTWAITVNSGVVSTIDIYDVTATATLLAGTPNDGTQPQTVTTLQLNTNGATQSWRGIGNNTSPAGTFNSSNFTVTSRFNRFFGPASTSPANSAAVRALPYNAFHTGGTTFTLATGNVQTKFVVALPPGVTISSVTDLSALNADITSEYVLTGTVNVLDAGGTVRAYNVYEMNIGIAYATSHTHSIVTVN